MNKLLFASIVLLLGICEASAQNIRGNSLPERITMSTSQPTEINIKSDYLSISVNVGETETLTHFLSEAYEIIPSDVKADVRWSVADESIVKYDYYRNDHQEFIEEYQPLKSGVTTLTAQVLSPDGGVILSSSQKVTVTVLQPVIDLIVVGNHKMEECNVGDDLTSYLNSLLQVLPDDASDKSVTWSIHRDGDAVDILSDGTIKAVKPGMVILQATSVNNPNAMATVTILVHNPAKDIRFASETVSAVYNTESVDISQKLIDNISFLPSDFESVEGFKVISDKSNDVVTIDEASFNQNTNELNLKARAIGAGEAIITVSIDYRDYLSDYTIPSATEHRTTVARSFTVNVIRGVIPVESLSSKSTREFEECNVGDDLTSYLNSILQVFPEESSDKSVTWSILRNGDAVAIFGDGTIKAVKPGMAIMQATSVNNPDAAVIVTVLVHNPATDIVFASDTVGVEYITEPVDISQKLIDNISFLPSDYESMEGLTVTSDRSNDVLVIDEVSFNNDNNELNLKARAIGVGKAVVTIGIDYHDYLSDYTMPYDTEHRTKVTRSFTVDVIQGIIPVKSLHNNSSRELEECNVGDDLTSYLNSLISVLPENADDKTILWSVAAGSFGDAVSIDADGVIKAVRSGSVKLVATSRDNRDATTSITVLVHNPATDIQFVNDNVNIEYNGRGSDISQQLLENISFLPSDFESVDGLTITSDNPNDVVIVDDYSYNQETHNMELAVRALGGGEATITVSIEYRDYLSEYTSPDVMEHRTKVTKSFTVTVTIPMASSLTYPDDLILSRNHDVKLQISIEPEYAILDPSLVEVRFEESGNEGWGTSAVAIPSAVSAIEWNLRGRFVGNYTYQVYYKGQPQLTNSGASKGTIHIPAEYLLEQGWDWVSLYATGPLGSLPLKTSLGWISPMQIDDDNYIQEIRSQNELLYKDPESGFFGDIEQLNAVSGMYKVNSHYDINNADQMVLSAGYDGLISSSTIKMPQVHKGYTWITYPHELNHSIEILGSYLKQSASVGDMIIGRDMFAVFDGSTWFSTTDFRFEAGKGYIYFTESPVPKTINWGPSALLPETEPNAILESRTAQQAVSPWAYDPYAYPDCMAVVASIEGITVPENYSIGAFVGDECRGQGEVTADGLSFITVSGQPGDIVTFRLYHNQLQNYEMINGKFNFVSHVGNLTNPLRLYADVTALRNVGESALSINFRNDVIMVNGAIGQPLISVTDLQGKRVSIHQGKILSVANLPVGIYIVCVSDGLKQIKTKIKK